jgi:glycosyltransferase involved in cell wall biosynthesis
MKGPLLVVDAFRQALESCPDLRLDYVGDGSLRSAVEQALGTAELRRRVTLHGYLPNETVRLMMRRSHIFLHPSQVGNGFRYDTCPVAVAEAMAEGMAIVAARHGGIPEEIEDGESGLLVAEGDARSMAQRLANLASDEQLRTRLGEAAWQRARAMFAPALVRQRWLELIGLEET